MVDSPPSTGKSVAVAGLSATSGVTLLLYVVHKFGIDDMPPEVAAAIIGLATTVAGAIMHDFQRRAERRINAAETNGVMGGPQPTAQ